MRCFLLLEPCTAQRLKSELSYRFLATEFVVFMTATASLKSGTKLAPTLPLRCPTASAAALKLKIALKSWSLVFTAATANLEFLGILDFSLLLGLLNAVKSLLELACGGLGLLLSARLAALW